MGDSNLCRPYIAVEWSCDGVSDHCSGVLLFFSGGSDLRFAIEFGQFPSTVLVDIMNGAAYLFEKLPLQNQRDWKAELELEQYRNIIKMEKIEKRMQIEKGGRWVYNKYE